VADPFVRVYHRAIANKFGLLLFAYVLPGTIFVIVVLARFPQISRLVANTPSSNAEDRIDWALLVVYQILALIFYVMLVGIYAIRKPLLQPVRNSIGMLAALGGSYLPFLFVALPKTRVDPTSTLLADVCIVVGIAFSVAGLTSLRRNFGILPEVRGLVRSGIYQYIRHPVYTGELVTVAGIAIPLIGPVAILCYTAFALLQYTRTRFEEAALERHFPEYAEYRRKAGRFLPGMP